MLVSILWMTSTILLLIAILVQNHYLGDYEITILHLSNRVDDLNKELKAVGNEK